MALTVKMHYAWPSFVSRRLACEHRSRWDFHARGTARTSALVDEPSVAVRDILERG